MRTGVREIGRRDFFILSATALILESFGTRGILKGDEETRTLESQVSTAWDAIWKRFYSSETHLFYDFLESQERGHTLDGLPTSEEVKALYPNVCGYGTGMEDCAISGGIVLEALIDRYVTETALGASDTMLASTRREAREVFEGLELLATVSGSSGFVARGVSPKAPGLCYINSSRDQVTHLALATWEYFRSSVSEDDTRARAAKILYAIAERMRQNVTAETNYDFLCADCSPCRIGISRMAEVEDHEAARLTAIYATAWDVATRLGETERADIYWREWRKIAATTIAQSAHIMENESLYNRMPSYAYLQMQESLNVLYRLEPDANLKKSLASTLTFVAGRASTRQAAALHRLKSRDLTVVAPSWREVGGLNGEYRTTWYSPRECGELALTLAFDPINDSLDAHAVAFLRESIMTPDFELLTSCGIFHLIGAYEKARRLGKL